MAAWYAEVKWSTSPLERSEPRILDDIQGTKKGSRLILEPLRVTSDHSTHAVFQDCPGVAERNAVQHWLALIPKIAESLRQA